MYHLGVVRHEPSFVSNNFGLPGAQTILIPISVYDRVVGIGKPGMANLIEIAVGFTLMFH